jgi:hypothetical protein
MREQRLPNDLYEPASLPYQARKEWTSMAMAPAGYDGTVPRVDDGERLVAGADVFGRDGEQVGTVADIGRGYFLVESGLFTIRSMYLPRSIVARVDEDGVHLAVAKGEAESMARQELPAEGDAWYGAQPSGVAPAHVRVVEMPLREQVLVTRTIATVRSEVHLRKSVTEHVERIAATVRREDVRVEAEGNGPGTAADDIPSVSAGFP